MPLFLGQSSADVAGVFRLGKHLTSSGSSGRWRLVGKVSQPLPPELPFWSLLLLLGCVILSKLTKLCLLSRLCVAHAARAVLAELINAGCSGELCPLLGPVERVVGFSLKTEGRPCRYD